MVDGLVLSAAAWLATVALHGLLIVALVALATRRMRSGPARERAWKIALCGALVTATVQLGLGVDPIGGAVALRRLPARSSAAAAAVTRRPVVQLVTLPAGLPAAEHGVRTARLEPPQAPPGSWIAPLPFVLTALEPLLEPGAPAPAVAAAPLAPLRRAAAGLAATADAVRSDLVRAALVLWAALAATGLALWGRRWRRLAHQIADRRTLAGHPRHLLERLCARAGHTRRVRLSVTPRLVAPITFGFARAEVCLPERALSQLREDELRAMLAHELAHVVRRDPLWLALAGFCERALFFQPLARLARRRWQEEAELACDDLAVRWTDERLSLATCLTEVAGWLLREPRALHGLPVPSMALAAHGRAGLGRRVRRLLDEPPAARGSRWIAPACVLGLASVVAAAPRIAPSARAAQAAPHVLQRLADDERAASDAAPRRGDAPFDEPFAVVPPPRADSLAPAAQPALELELAADPAASPAPVETPVATDARERTSPAPAPDEARHVIGPRGQADVAPATPEPGLDDLLRGLERSIALLEGELRAIAGEAQAREGWRERVERLEQRIARLGEQHRRLAATAALLVALDAAEPRTTNTHSTAMPGPSGTQAETNLRDEVKR